MAITQSEVDAERILSLNESIKQGLAHPGLPRPLPPGESVVWQGTPNVLAFARQVFHVGVIVTYFGILMAWRLFAGLSDGKSLDVALADTLSLAALGALVVGLVMLLARTMARASIYTITTKRIVFRIGAASVKTIDLPFTRIERVEVKANAKGAGDISITLKEDGRGTPYLLLWPHARPWHFRWPQPTLRGLDDARAAAELLGARLHAALRDDMRQKSEEEAQADAEQQARYAQERRALMEARAAQEQAHQQRAAASERRERPVILAMFGLALASLIAVGIIRVASPPTPFHQAVQPVASYDLTFVTGEAGALEIVDLRNGAVLATVPSSGEGLLRNAVRGLERTRTLEGLPLDAPYQLILWPEDKITLSDPVSNKHIPLTSFLPMNTGVLAKLRALTARAD